VKIGKDKKSLGENKRSIRTLEKTLIGRKIGTLVISVLGGHAGWRSGTS